MHDVTGIASSTTIISHQSQQIKNKCHSADDPYHISTKGNISGPTVERHLVCETCSLKGAQGSRQKPQMEPLTREDTQTHQQL